MGHARVFVPERRLSGHRRPEPLASVATVREGRPVRGHRGDLPASRYRSVQHDDRRGRDGHPRDRPADLAGNRGRRARAVPEEPWRSARHRSDLHALPHRSLRRRRRRSPGRSRRRPDPRPRRVPRTRGGRKRLRRNRYGTPRHLHVWRVAPQGAARSRRRRPRHQRVVGCPRTDPTDRRHHPHRSGGDRRRHPDHLPGDAGNGGARRDELPVPGPPGTVHGGERHPQSAQSPHAAGRAGPGPRAWSRYLDQAIEMFDGGYDVAFASHHWPTWGRDRW